MGDDHYEFNFSEFMTRPISPNFEMEHPLYNCVLVYGPFDDSMIQLTLFNCCDTYGHLYRTQALALFRENTLVADMKRMRCVRCEFSPEHLALAHLVDKTSGKISLADARRYAQQYLSVTRPSQSYRDLTAS